MASVTVLIDFCCTLVPDDGAVLVETRFEDWILETPATK
jgi:hypothetical protein